MADAAEVADAPEVAKAPAAADARDVADAPDAAEVADAPAAVQGREAETVENSNDSEAVDAAEVAGSPGVGAPQDRPMADAATPDVAPLPSTGRPFRPPWWAGNKTAAATAVETPPRQAPAVDGQTPVSTTEAAALPVPGQPTADQERSTRLDRWFAAHGSALLWLVPVMVVAGVVAALGIAGPARTGQEALYAGFVWQFLAFGDLAPFTAWAQHPPLGWMQMAAYVQFTGAFDRWDFAVLAVRESMVPFAVATAGAAWMLGRRVGLSRLIATVAALVLVFAPFALAQHTAVSLENVATPWLLVAFVLATSRRMQPLAFALSAAAFAVAVLSAETAVLGLPFLAWVMFSSTVRGARVWPLVTAAVTLQLISGGYLVIASGDPAAIAPTSPVFAAIAAVPAAIATWWAADPVLLVLVVVGAVAALGNRALRPLAAFSLAGTVVLAIPGVVTPDGFPALILPFGVIALVGATEQAVRAIRARGAQRSVLPVVLVTVVALGAVVAVPLALTRLPAALAAAGTDPSGRAERWVIDNVAPGSPVLVDTASRVDFLRAGWSRDEIIDYDGSDGALPATWTQADWAVVPASRADEADGDSLVVASFDDIDVRRVLPGLVDAATTEEADRVALRASLGAELAENPDVELADADRELLTSGLVDDRIVSVLGALTVFGRIDVAGFPVVAGEDSGPRRQVALAAAGGEALVQDGELTEAGRDVVAGLLDRYAPETALVRGGLLVLRYPITLGAPAE